MTEQSVSDGNEHPVNDINRACFLSNDEIMSHIDRLQKERDVWRALYDEKKQLASKVLEENSSSEDATVLLMTENDLKFMSEVPDYQKLGELYEELSKIVVIVNSQHDKTKRCFKEVLESIISLSCFPNIHKTI